MCNLQKYKKYLRKAENEKIFINNWNANAPGAPTDRRNDR